MGFDYVTDGETNAYESYLYKVLGGFEDYFGMSSHGVTSDDFVRGMLNGTIKEEYLKMTWSLGLGIPHPRGFTGCEFWTSFEVTLVLGVSLCDVGHHRSLRSPCPVSCGCLHMNHSRQAECPGACSYA